MALGKKLMNVNTTEKISGEDKPGRKTGQEPEKDTVQEAEKDTAKESENIPAAGQRSLKDILESLTDDEFIVTVPIEREEKENE